MSLFFQNTATIVNVTILNGMGVSGWVVGTPTWHPYTPHNGQHLDVGVTYSSTIWPWAGWIALHLSVRPEAAEFEGIAQVKTGTKKALQITLSVSPFIIYIS